MVQQYIGQPQGRVTTLRGDGAGGLTVMTPAPRGAEPARRAVGDFDRNGTLDVVTGSTVADTITFLPGLGGGNFGPLTTTAIGGGAYYMTPGHFNGDSILDLAATGQTVGKRTLILQGEGNGTTTVSVFRGGADSRNPVLCDFDHNGAVDIAVANAGTSNVAVLLGSGNLVFTEASNVGTDNGPAGAISGDISLDGFCDVVTANEGSDSVSILMGGGSATVSALRPSPWEPPRWGRGRGFQRRRADRSRHREPRRQQHHDLPRQRRGVDVRVADRSCGVQPGAIAAADFNQDGAPTWW